MACAFDSRTAELERNLLTLYRDALPCDVSLGERWYPEAHRIVVEWSGAYGYSIATVASVIAALSPQQEWTRNLIQADDCLAGRYPSVRGIAANYDKAERIRVERADSPMGYFKSAPKVCSFARNLAGDMDYVTVDTHATQAALNDVQLTVTLKWNRYVLFALCYERAARKVHRSPAEFQAIIWHTWKRKYPVERKRQLRRQWDVIGEY